MLGQLYIIKDRITQQYLAVIVVRGAMQNIVVAHHLGNSCHLP